MIWAELKKTIKRHFKMCSNIIKGLANVKAEKTHIKKMEFMIITHKVDGLVFMHETEKT